MEVRIKQTGIYSLFGLPHGKVGAQSLAAGDVVELPEYYATELIEQGMVEEYVEPAKETVAEEVVTEEDPQPTTKRRPRKKATPPKPDTERHISEVATEEAFDIAKRSNDNEQ